MKFAGQLIMYYRIHSALREACQSMIGQRYINTSLGVRLKPNFRESELHTDIHRRNVTFLLFPFQENAITVDTLWRI